MASANPLRAGLAVFVAGFLVVWLIKPIGNPCPDRGALPQGSTTSSAPSPLPGTRTCTYTTPLGTRARARYWPWLDWLVLALLAGAVGYGVRAASGEQRAPRSPRDRAPTTRPSGERRTEDATAFERDAAQRERQRAERERRRQDG